MTKTPFLLALLALSVVLAIAPRAFAQANPNPPERLAYQGFLVDANGIPLATNAPKNYDVIFRIWSDSSATATTNRLWTEQQTVTVDKGYFSVVLGEGSSIGEARPLLSAVFAGSTASERWIGLTVKGIGAGGSDANILPRLRLITSPYAYLASKAMTVDGAAVTSGTVGDARLSSNVALRNGGNTFSGNQTFNNNVGIGIGPSARPLTVNGAGNTGISLANSTAGTGKPYLLTSLDDGRFLIKDDITGSLAFFMDKVNPSFYMLGGNLGIGTSTPGFPLTFPNALGDKISLWGQSGNNVGFGIQGNLFQIHSDVVSADIAFGYGSSAAMTETMRIKGTGNVGIGTSNPQAKLHVNGSITVETNNGLFFADGGEIRSTDVNHRILFRRSENKLELREYGDLIFSSGAITGTETAKAVLQANGNMGIGTTNPAARLHVAGAGNFLGSTPYVKFSDQKAKGSTGGSATSGINARTFNTRFDPQNFASILNNTNLVLPAGTYQCRISAPAFRVNLHQARLRIANSSALFIFGTSEQTDGSTEGSSSTSVITGQFTLAAQSNLVVEHYTQANESDRVLGPAVNAPWTDGNPQEVFTVAEFWKLQ